MAENHWDKRKALKTYGIRKWGVKYFDINARGNVIVSPRKDLGGTIDLMDIVAEAKRRGVHPPLLVRFQDLLHNRVKEINESFRKSIAEYDYKGRYQGVFPIKVNQLREVVEEILEAGEPYQFGLEAGSRAELLVAMALVKETDRLIVCNGYKDAAFIRLALNGKRLGKRILLVVEKLTELALILRLAKEMGVEPDIGIRLRLHSKGGGKWESSSGENAKFGLSTAELLAAVAMLRAEKLERSFQLIHFHIGSQIPDIRSIKKAVSEAARVYAKLCRSGLNVRYIDAGGGLGVDYVGSRSYFKKFTNSTNYGLDEYTNSVVSAILDVCSAENVPHPDIVTESGRAIVAHHSVLIMELFGSIEKGKANGNGKPAAEGAKSHPLVEQLAEVRKEMANISPMETYHDAVERLEQARSLFQVGYLSLEDKAEIETLFWDICRALPALKKPDEEWPPELENLETSLAKQYLGNFSLFQSLIDHWAIGHLFPLMPIHRLNECPAEEATLVDITCDSDGKICKFIDEKSVRETLPLHELRPGEPYYIGAFLVGAYQEIMGDLHNLFGRSSEIHCFLDASEPTGYYIEEVIEGSTVGQVLSEVQYHPHELEQSMKEQIDRAVKEGRIKASEGVRMLDDYESAMRQPTYLKLDETYQLLSPPPAELAPAQPPAPGQPSRSRAGAVTPS